MSYTQTVLEDLKARYPEQTEFIQAATEILGTLQPALDAHPEYEEAAILERLVEPERIRWACSSSWALSRSLRTL